MKERVLQYMFSIGGGFLLAFETSIPFFIPCLLSVFLDVLSAYFLARRVHKKYPEKADGKFKSEYKYRVIYTMIIAFILLIIAAYFDMLVLKDGDAAVRTSMCIFLFYEGWSVLENWSSENDNKLARALQRIMVNKAERHFDVKLGDILLEEDNNDKNKQHEKV